MTWTYIQKTGELYRDGVKVGEGYSGHSIGLDNPVFEDERMIGPIPHGSWTIGTWMDHPHLGPCVAHLNPSADTETFGRSSFFIHGDNAYRNHTGSDGCIVLPPDIRHMMARSQDSELLVT